MSRIRPCRASTSFQSKQGSSTIASSRLSGSLYCFDDIRCIIFSTCAEQIDARARAYEYCTARCLTSLAFPRHTVRHLGTCAPIVPQPKSAMSCFNISAEDTDIAHPAVGAAAAIGNTTSKLC